MVADCNEALCAGFVVCSCFQEVHEAIETVGFNLVEAIQSRAADGMDAEKDGVGAAAPEEAGELGVLVDVVGEPIYQHHEE